MTTIDDTTAVAVGDLTFDVRTGGPSGGAPVVLLHGFPQTSWAWHRQIPTLAGAGYRSVAPDQRGYSPGARPEGAAAYAVDLLVGDVLGLADAMGLDRFHLVGHDWGGMVAWHVAARHPDRLRSLAVLSTPHPTAFRQALVRPLSGQALRSFYGAVFQVPGVERIMLAGGGAGLRAALRRSGLTSESADRYGQALGTPEALGAALNWYRAARPSDTSGLPPITVPTLYVWSTGDVALGRTAAEATAAFVEGPYRFEVLEGVSHWIPEAAAEVTNRLLLDHLEAHPG